MSIFGKLTRPLGLKFHDWTYRNPYSRQCKHCNTVQNYYQITHTRGKWCNMSSKVIEGKCYFK